jgi:hypothetical protein
MPKQIENIFSDTACPPKETMFMYMDNLLKGEEKHAFERHLAGCSLCADAFDGLSMMSRSEAEEDVAALYLEIENQYAAVANRRNWPLAVAASVSLLLIAGTWAYLHNDNVSDVAVEKPTKTINKEERVKEPELNPSADVNKIALDTSTIAPADKTIALTEQEVNQKNISSDAGVNLSPKPQEEYFSKKEISPVPSQAREEDDIKVTTTTTGTSGVVSNNNFRKDIGREKSEQDQNKASIENENISPGSAGISSGMLAYAESVLYGNSDAVKGNAVPVRSMEEPKGVVTVKPKPVVVAEQKREEEPKSVVIAKPEPVVVEKRKADSIVAVVTKPKDPVVIKKQEPIIVKKDPVVVKTEPVVVKKQNSNKAGNAPSTPYLMEEERKKTKSMEGCKNCPDKEISQSAAQDMQELTYDYAVKKFNEKSYADAHLKFDQYIKENPGSEEAGRAGIYDAISLVYLNKPEEALTRLNNVLISHRNFADDAKWLKAAVYIDQDRIKEATALLQELEKSKAYKEKASKALQDLR